MVRENLQFALLTLKKLMDQFSHIVIASRTLHGLLFLGGFKQFRQNSAKSTIKLNGFKFVPNGE